ncbi:MAG: 50S ribosomal protein L3 [Candidatus Woesearchaeota archaeon]|nr:MAG: 50S ribosomal protein L3 [Candidatus Woesearchaeota archaeon]
MKARNPRHGSMQFWPRKRASRMTPRVRSWPESNNASFLGFPAYKAGMTHVSYLDSYKNSITKGREVSIPVTILEAPSVHLLGVQCLKPSGYGEDIAVQLMFKTDKDIARTLTPAKTYATVADLDKLNPDDYSTINVLVSTQPRKTGFAKKKPDVVALGLGGSNKDKLAFVKEHIGKEIAVSDVFKANDLVDVHGVTKGKGFQGPVKRFGIALRSHKSEKARRNPGSLGSWKGQAHMMYRIAHAGQMGTHLRTQFNQKIVKISDNPEEIKIAGGIVRYGLVRTTYILVKGSIQGPKKRLVTLVKPTRPNKNKAARDESNVTHISLASPQGR